MIVILNQNKHKETKKTYGSNYNIGGHVIRLFFLCCFFVLFFWGGGLKHVRPNLTQLTQ